MKPRTEEEKSRRLYKLALAHKDIRGALLICDGYIELLRAQPAGRPLAYAVNYAFMSAIITCYCRPFVDNKSTGVLPKCWTRFTNPTLQAAHYQMIKARHEVYAHSDSDVAKMNIIPAGAPLQGLGRNAPRASWRFASHEFPPDSIFAFGACCADLKARLEAEVSAVVEEIAAMSGSRVEFELKGDRSGPVTGGASSK